MQDIFQKLESVVQRTLQNNSLKLDPQTSAESIEGWDSMAHVMILSEVESTFQIRFKLAELRDLEVIGDLVGLIEKKIR